MKERFIKVSGVIIIEKDRVSIDLSYDLCRYYLWHIKKATYNTLPLFTPRHGSHISVVLPTIHGKYIKEDLRKKLSRWQGKKVDVRYSLDILTGGKSKGFTNFWTRVECEEIERIKYLLGIKESDNYKGAHITFCSTKHAKNERIKK